MVYMSTNVDKSTDRHLRTSAKTWSRFKSEAALAGLSMADFLDQLVDQHQRRRGSSVGNNPLRPGS